MMTTELTIEVSDEETALEIAYGILGRAQDIHENPHDDFEHIALELRDIGQDLRDKYE